MLRLKLPTDKRWAELAQNDLKEALIDHAFCEQKAASSAISIIVQYPEYSELVDEMSKIAQEEMQHFEMVHQKILDRGWVLGRERKDEYVNKLAKYFKKTGDRRENLVHKLLFSAMIEARSCERFRVLSTTVEDEELRDFYNELTKSEAGHYALFLRYAHKYGDEIMDVSQKWEEFLDFEAEVISEYGKSARMHG
jgi:tRNA-(ms[2]io[6]A)-hydroxylase